LVFLSATALTIIGPSAHGYAANSNPPKIENVNSVLFGGYVYVSGKVSDDGEITGVTVQFSGNISGSTTVGKDGVFWFRAPFDYPYGSGSVRATDKDNIKSDPVNFEFHE
jgi:hypothetical protein